MQKILRSSLQLYKDAYSGLPREIWILGILTVINRMGTMVLPFLSVYLTSQLHFSLKDAGLIASAFGFGSLSGSYLGGRLTDKIGAKPVIGGSLLIGGAFFLTLPYVDSFTGLFILIFCASVFGEAYRPAMSAAAAQYMPRAEAGRAMAFLRLAINLGMSAAPTIGGFVAVGLGYNYLFWIDGFTCMIAASYFLIVARKWRKPAISSPSQEQEQIDATIETISPYKNGRYWIFLLATFLMGFAFIQWFHTIPVFIKQEWKFDEGWIGVLMGTSSFIVTLIEMPITHLVERGNHIKKAIRLGLLLFGISYLPFVLESSILLCFVAVILWTIGEILVLPFNNAYPLNISHAQNRGNYLALYFMTWSLTNITGPTVGLAFADEFGFSAFWILLTCLIMTSLLINMKVVEK